MTQYVGKPIRRSEDARLLTGQALFVDDVHLPNMAHVAFLRSPYAHARITGIDTSAAEALPGVIAVHTAESFSATTGNKGRFSSPPRQSSVLHFTNGPNRSWPGIRPVTSASPSLP